jgi:hypothetical protein
MSNIRTNTQIFDNDQYCPPKLTFKKCLRSLSHATEKEHCFGFASLKVSFYSTTASTLKIHFHPSQNIMTYSGGMLSGAFPTELIPKNTIQFTVPANTYKLFCVPIEGEMVNLEVTIADNTNEKETYLKCLLTNQSVQYNFE